MDALKIASKGEFIRNTAPSMRFVKSRKYKESRRFRTKISRVKKPHPDFLLKVIFYQKQIIFLTKPII